MKHHRYLQTLMVILIVLCALSVADTGSACTGIPNLEHSSVASSGGLLLVCPRGDGPTLGAIGATITITVKSMCPDWDAPLPIAGIPASDIWLWSNDIELCGGSRSADADAPTDAAGQTTLSGSVGAGGFAATGVSVIVQGIAIGNVPGLALVSPDFNGDLTVNLSDWADLGLSYNVAYDPRFDLDGNGMLHLIDMVIFARHWQHTCE